MSLQQETCFWYDPKLDQYMKDIGSLKRLSKKAEHKLAAEVAQGSCDAIDVLVKYNLRLVVKIAHDFYHGKIPMLDLVAAGNIGLVCAAKRFDPTKGSKFSSYAAWWIKQAIRRIIPKHRVIPIPVSAAENMYKINRAYDELGEWATDEAIANTTGISIITIQTLKSPARRVLSLDEAIGKEGETTYAQILPSNIPPPNDDSTLIKEYYSQIDPLIDALLGREQYVIIRRFGLRGHYPMTLKEVSEGWDLTVERVRQIQFEALDKMAKAVKH